MITLSNICLFINALAGVLATSLMAAPAGLFTAQETSWIIYALGTVSGIASLIPKFFTNKTTTS